MLSSGGLGCLTMSAYGQFGYSYPSASQLLVAGQGSSGASPPLVSPGASSVPPGGVSPNSNSVPAGGSTGSGASCCDSGRPLMTDPVSGQTVCSCQYDSARLALSSYPRLSASGVYGAPYPSTDQNPYPSIGVDSSAFYSPLSNPYGLKEGGSSADMSAWTSAGLQTTTGYYPYDPTLAAYGYGAAGYDLAARRKNATRESTATLKAWLNEHKKNPYPTKGEKIMLAIITKMTLTQVSTWFANARRRLKKENKMTWEPKNKTDDDDEAVVSDGDSKEKDDMSFDGDKVKDRLRDDKDPLSRVKLENRHDKDLDDDDDLDDDGKDDELMGHHHSHHMHLAHQTHPAHLAHQHMLPCLKDELKNDCGIPIPATKPKIWSLADTAACKTPPPPPAQPWPASGGNFAHPSAAMSPAAPTTPYSRYSGFLGHYNNTFPEVQTDTPPQTPPNMKLPNLVNSNACAQQGGQGGYQQGFGNGYARLPPQQAPMGGMSPHKDRQDFPMQQNMRHSSHSNAQHSHQAAPTESTAFKPFFKGSPPMTNGFVSPV